MEIVPILRKNGFWSILTTFDHFLSEEPTGQILKNSAFSILEIRIPAQIDLKSAKNRPNNFLQIIQIISDILTPTAFSDSYWALRIIRWKTR